jgi:hypothetical protein
MASKKHGHPRLSTPSILRLQTLAHGCTRLLLRLGITNGVLCSRHSACTQSTYGMQCSTPHQCVSSKPISFQTPYGTRLARALPTPVLALHALTTMATYRLMFARSTKHCICSSYSEFYLCKKYDVMARVLLRAWILKPMANPRRGELFQDDDRR